MTTITRSAGIIVDDVETTATPDRIVDGFTELLDEVLHDAVVSYGDEQDLDLSARIEDFQRDYEVIFDEFETSEFGAYISLSVSYRWRTISVSQRRSSIRRQYSPASRLRPTPTKHRRRRCSTTRIRI